MLFGNKIRELRDENGVLQRQLAALLEIDTPMFSKIERGDRRAKREQVIKLAEYFHQDENEMLTLWLADKVLDAASRRLPEPHERLCDRTPERLDERQRYQGAGKPRPYPGGGRRRPVSDKRQHDQAQGRRHFCSRVSGTGGAR